MSTYPTTNKRFLLEQSNDAPRPSRLGAFGVRASCDCINLPLQGELLLTIMSSLAQEESRSISENVTCGIRKSFSDGKVCSYDKSYSLIFLD